MTYEEAVAAAGTDRDDGALALRLLPALAARRDAKAASTLATRLADDPSAAAELCAALAIAGAVPDDAAGWLGRQRGDATFARVARDVGWAAFAFPLWRFAAARVDGPAILEAFGMTRLERPTDRGSDDLGIGFATHRDGLRVELRRAYVAVSDPEAGGGAVVVRNASPHFGRDRLDDPVAASEEPHDDAAMDALRRETLRRDAGWLTLSDAASAGNMEVTARLLAAARRLDDDLARFMRDEGRDTTARVIEGLARRGVRAHVAVGDGPDSLPWLPRLTIPVGVLTTRAVRSGTMTREATLALLSGPDGDRPADTPEAWLMPARGYGRRPSGATRH